jgi:PAS domain S-box-containing protein
MNAIPDIVFRLDASGRITFMSPAVLRYAKDPKDLLGRHILELVAPDHRARATRRIDERRTGRRATSNLELKLLLPGGESGEGSGFFSVSAEGLYGSAPPNTSSFLGTQGIARDITNRKRLEFQLARSQRMEAIGSLAAGVAHDLNNILSGLVGYPELILLELPEDSPLRQRMEKIRESGQRAAAVVQDMLTLARRGVSTDEVVDLNGIVEGYLASPEFERMRADHPRVDFQKDLAADLMAVKGAPVHLTKVVMNLVSNAAEAAPSGGQVTIATRNRYVDTRWTGYEPIPEGEYVRLSVLDNGIGISTGDLRKIFEPFYTKKRMGQSGTGLGMTVVWSTVKDHRGFVDVRTREGMGTRFDVYLPVTREAPDEIEPRVVLQDYLGTEHILVVDDVAEQREIAEQMLSKLGYRVASVPSGEEALAYLAAHRVDLVVLDMVMEPGMDGLETYRQMIDEHPGQRAIIASGYSESERVRSLQEMGAGAYIRKPYSLETIGLAVRREIDR